MPHHDLAKYPCVVLVAFLVTYLLTPVLRRYAGALRLLDMPDGRRLHDKVTPRGGGIAVFAGFHAGCAAIFLLPWMPFAGQLDLIWWRNFLFLSSIMLLVGIFDDVYRMRPVSKLCWQIFVASLAYFLNMRIGTILTLEIPPYLDFVATVFWFVAICNAFNLIDGMDGLASGISVIAAIGLAGSLILRRMPSDSLVLLSLLGACAAFLRYNFYPASIFLGDSGSLFLGFAFAAIAVSTRAKGTAVATLGMPLLALGVPILDTILAIWRRAAKQLLDKDPHHDTDGAVRDHVFSADMEHLHHRMISRGLSQRTVATCLYGASVVLVVVGLLSMVFHSRAAGIYAVAFVVGVYVVVRHIAHVELYHSGAAIIEGLQRPQSKMLGVILYPPLDISILAASLAVSLSLTNPAGPALKHLWLDHAPVWIGLPFIFTAIAGTYRRVWSRARISEHVYVALMVATGILFAAGVSVILIACPARDSLLKAIIYGGIAVPLIAGARAFPRVVQDTMFWIQRSLPSSHERRKATLVYGAGFRATLFLRERSFGLDEHNESRLIVGLIDEDANLHDRFVHGFAVLGSLEELPRILDERHVDEIIITEPIDDRDRATLLEVADRNNVAVMEWITLLKPVTRGSGDTEEDDEQD